VQLVVRSTPGVKDDLCPEFQSNITICPERVGGWEAKLKYSAASRPSTEDLRSPWPSIRVAKQIYPINGITVALNRLLQLFAIYEKLRGMSEKFPNSSVVNI